jgi:PPK2 family polyphosphate:nucleotide phosphotransferase
MPTLAVGMSPLEYLPLLSAKPAFLALFREKAIISYTHPRSLSPRTRPMRQPLTLPPGKKFRLSDFDASYSGGIKDKKEVETELEKNIEVLSDLAYRLYAENRRALLLVLQGMDTSGKDGTIRHAMKGFNPQSCQVTSFKQPSIMELDHDFLWRIARAMPGKGNVGIFNRSQYEDVLIVRVHDIVPKKEWRTRYDRINLFEQMAHQGGTTIVKVFLHISKDEQRKRLQSRLDDPQKRWKFSKADLAEREYWSDYQKAYNDALTLCNTDYAPWYIVPANKKWYRNLAVSRILRQTLEKMNPQYPPAEEGLDGLVVK